MASKADIPAAPALAALPPWHALAPAPGVALGRIRRREVELLEARDEAHLAAPHTCAQVADLCHPIAHAVQRERSRVDARHLLPPQRRGGAGIRCRADRVGRSDRAI